MASSQCAINGIISLYTDLALNPNKDFGWDKGLENAKAHGYKEEWLSALPLHIWDYCAAVGNPFLIGDFPSGSVVADLGCGAGVDACVASLHVGKSGKVIGIDITPKMVETAHRHALESGLTNVEIREGHLEQLPINDDSVDIVISNGAINLASSKSDVFSEIHRVLKSDGKLYFADMIKVNGMDCKTSCCSSEKSSNDWANCVEGTLTKEELITIITDAGFANVECIGLNHYKTSDSTVGATFRAIKSDANFKQRHWENVYQTKDIQKVGWYQEHPTISLSLLNKIGSTANDRLIDVGCGASPLADILIESGYHDITLLDISSNALEIVKNRLKNSSVQPLYHYGDVCTYAAEKPFDIWHDRAVFHFLRNEKDKNAYFDVLYKSLSADGRALIGTFAINGPDSCSALPVEQYDLEKMVKVAGSRFEILETIDDTHITPSGNQQLFCYFILKAKYTG